MLRTPACPPAGCSGNGIRHGIVAATAPGMATGDAGQRQAQPAPGAVAAECFEGVFRARRVKAAGGRRPEEPRLERRKDPTVPLHQDDQERAHACPSDSGAIGTLALGCRGSRLGPESSLAKASAQVPGDSLKVPRRHRRPGHQNHRHRSRDLMLLEAISLAHQPAGTTADNRPAHLPAGHQAQAAALPGSEPPPIDNQAAADPPFALGSDPHEFTRALEPLSAAQPKPGAEAGIRHRSDGRQPFAALGATGIDDLAPAPGGHACPEAELTLAADLRRLVLAFHG